MWAITRSKTAKTKVFTYFWNHPLPGPDVAQYGAFHTSEVPYVLNTLEQSDRPFTDVDRKVADLLSSVLGELRDDRRPERQGSTRLAGGRRQVLDDHGTDRAAARHPRGRQPREAGLPRARRVASMIAGLRPVDAGRAIDQRPWGGYQRWLVFLTAVTIVFDGIDNQMLGVTIPSIMADWHVPRSAFAPIVSLGYLGMMIGGAAAGLAGDRFGRRSALLVCMVIFGGATLAVSTAGSVGALATLRLVAGVGLGGAVPNAAALAAEFVPVARRALAVTLTIVCVPLGATLAGLIAIPALPAFGWRALFVLGGRCPDRRGARPVLAAAGISALSRRPSGTMGGAQETSAPHGPSRRGRCHFSL